MPAMRGWPGLWPVVCHFKQAQLHCHSERSEESYDWQRRKIPRYTRNDNQQEK